MFRVPAATQNSQFPHTTFLFPNFNKSLDHKVDDWIDTISPSRLRLAFGNSFVSAIATKGFSSRADGVYVFAMRVHHIQEKNLMVGFTNTKICDENDGNDGCGPTLSGTCLRCFDGSLSGDVQDYLPPDITRRAREIISILAISGNGSKKESWWIVDGVEGPPEDCSEIFQIDEEHDEEIFPAVCLADQGQEVECLALDQVQCSSLMIVALRKKFEAQNKRTCPVAPSTSTVENDALITELRAQVSQRQAAAVRDRDEMIKHLREQLMAASQHHREDLSEKDQTHRADVEIKEKQLELERAEHQKTRNLLHQIKMELKDMEIYYLRREKEFGQRRQRDAEKDQFDVKQEPAY